ncbi:MAG: hypothetical protein WAO35_02565 [Terriglobia bacterium]
MKKTHREGSVAVTWPDDDKFRKVNAKLRNAFMRLAASDREKVMRIITQFTFGKACSISYWEWSSKENLESCYRQLQRISQKMAEDLRSLASELLRLKPGYYLALKSLTEKARRRK